MNLLRECAIAVYEILISKLFWNKLKFGSDSIKHWFKTKHTRRFLELDRLSKMWYERKNQRDWSQTKSAIYGFKYSFGVVNSFDSDEITYFDFLVKKSNMFLRDIYKTEE